MIELFRQHCGWCKVIPSGNELGHGRWGFPRASYEYNRYALPGSFSESKGTQREQKVNSRDSSSQGFVAMRHEPFKGCLYFFHGPYMTLTNWSAGMVKSSWNGTDPSHSESFSFGWLKHIGTNQLKRRIGGDWFTDRPKSCTKSENRAAASGILIIHGLSDIEIFNFILGTFLHIIRMKLKPNTGGHPKTVKIMHIYIYTYEIIRSFEEGDSSLIRFCS